MSAETTDTIHFEIACVCGEKAFIGEKAVYHTGSPCHMFELLSPGPFARGLRIWWTLEGFEREERTGVCERVQGNSVAPGWGCCQCKVYNGLGRDVCKRCGHLCCALEEAAES